jgi:hypothetical protein
MMRHMRFLVVDFLAIANEKKNRSEKPLKQTITLSFNRDSGSAKPTRHKALRAI